MIAKFAKMYFFRIGLVFYICIYYTVDAWSSGAPSSACKSMTPGHGNSVQTSSSPIGVSLSTGNHRIITFYKFVTIFCNAKIMCLII